MNQGKKNPEQKEGMSTLMTCLLCYLNSKGPGTCNLCYLRASGNGTAGTAMTFEGDKMMSLEFQVCILPSICRSYRRQSKTKFSFSGHGSLTHISRECCSLSPVRLSTQVFIAWIVLSTQDGLHTTKLCKLCNTNYNLPKPICSQDISFIDAFFSSFNAVTSPQSHGSHATCQNPV